MKKVHAYGFRNGPTLVPARVINALGEPCHVRQARVLIWATSATAAATCAAQYGIHTTPASLHLAHGNYATALTDAQDWPAGTVLVLPLRMAGPVVQLANPALTTITGHTYDLTIIGRITHCANGYGSVFSPPGGGSKVTDGMFNAAWDALLAELHDEKLSARLIPALRKAITAALDAKDTP